MFDSPFTFCPRCQGMVLTDQTRRECAQEHGCAGTDADCPLRAYFTGIDFREGKDECKSEPKIDASSGGRRSTRP